jgi:hypothetical protein
MKTFLPYLPVLIAAALMIRRSRQTRKVNPRRMWIRPVFLILLLAGAISGAPMPGLIAIVAFVAAAAAGGFLGNFMASHQHLTIDPETGQLSSRASTIGTLLVLGLFAIRFGAKLVFPELADPGHHASQMTAAANGLLVFTVAVLISQTVSIWQRTRPLIAEHTARKTLNGSAGPGAESAGAAGEISAQPPAQSTAQPTAQATE